MRVLSLIVLLLINSSSRSEAQPTTPLAEVNALNSVFGQWQISSADSTTTWNISGEPCSGEAVNTTDFESTGNNPGIMCSCDRTTCHITRIRVVGLNVQGIIPPQLAQLSFLEFLKLDQNYLTGPLPPFLGNFSSLWILSVAINALSGPIPKELGNLSKLRILSFGSNNFSGQLPPELGSLANLEQFYLASAGLSGQIPNTFAKLAKMQTICVNDNFFTGKIPDYIGNWTALKTLKFEGTTFEGPIPASFSNLVSLEDLRISDLSNVSSSMDFVRNLRNLTILILRNDLISGNIPSSIGELQRLQRLDLSFNNLTGQIPTSIFNLSSLSIMFLGNNSLSGAIPPQKRSTIRAVDLSFNRLSGGLPAWVTEDNLELNVIANNLTLNSSVNSLLASGLNCLQGQFPCNRGAPLFSSFAINCGGPESRSSDGTVYETENSTLGAASYFVRDAQNWAVSNVGVFSDSQPSIIQTNQAQATATLNPDLFQTARLSPGSLRYFGLGLENGPYNVNLQFSETVIPDESARTWESLGKRVFDIYLQGGLREKDFDIRALAGGAMNRAVNKNYNVTVSENFLDIHLFWAGKGTCQRRDCGPSISAIKVTPEFTPTVRNRPVSTTSSENKSGMIVGITVSMSLLFIICALILFYLKRRRSRSHEEEELLGIVSMADTFSYAELKSATGDFSPTNKLGEGGFGPVYKGTLSDEREIAVKKLMVTSHQGKSQFVAEISIISAVQHRNLVKLYGCCIEGNNRLLVYEYLKNKSLDQALFGETGMKLDWGTRYNICLGAARGLAYLHEESNPRIVHRDVKASNILLDPELNPKISDFGLAKLYDDKKTHISTRVAGTIGYLAPEYAMRGHLTEKADVFGFGVVALEILCGRPNTDTSLDPEMVYLLEWAWTLYETGRGLELVDPCLVSFDEEEASRMLGIALLCTQASPMMRPTMSKVIVMLTGDADVSIVASKPSYLTDWQFNDLTSSFVTSDTTGSTNTTTPYVSSSNTNVVYDSELILSPQPMLQDTSDAFVGR